MVGIANAFGIDEIWAAFASRGGIDEGQLHAHCRSVLPAIFVPRRLLRVDRIPINEMGKLDRRRLAELVGGPLR